MRPSTFTLTSGAAGAASSFTCGSWLVGADDADAGGSDTDVVREKFPSPAPSACVGVCEGPAGNQGEAGEAFCARPDIRQSLVLLDCGPGAGP